MASEATEFKTDDQLPKGNVVLLFYAVWSEQSLQMRNVVELLKEEKSMSSIKFIAIEAEKHPKLAFRHSIKAVPELKEVGRLSGVYPNKVNEDIQRVFLKNHKVENSRPNAIERIKSILAESRVVLFMKGSGNEPRCKFSREMIELLQGKCGLSVNDPNVKVFDIFKDDEIREELKKFSSWPTYPQLYINGDLIGGVDIVRDMCDSGSLQEQLTGSLRKKIDTLINKDKVMLFMKGSPEAPLCGFSREIVNILNNAGVKFSHFDILKDQKVREELKVVSKWPTYPQLYVSGQLIGGLDIVKEQFLEVSQSVDDLIPTNDSDEDFEGFEKEVTEGEADVDGMLNNIFGDSEEEEFEGFAENEVIGKAKPSLENTTENIRRIDYGDGLVSRTGALDYSSSDEDSPDDDRYEPLNELELIIERRREENRRRKRRKDSSYISAADDIGDSVIRRMREVAEEDREKVRLNLPATSKLRMLKHVEEVLQRVDLRASMIDQGVLKCIMDWLSPVKGNVLPSLPIRQVLLRQLLDFPTLDEDTLRSSGIGKAVMYLSKHPDEKEESKKMCRDLIYKWSQTVFNLKSDYRSLTREERVDRDREKLAKRRRTEPEVRSHRDLVREMDGEERSLRPGEPGFVFRARVPQPSRKDYLVRPAWKVKTPLEHTKHQKSDNSDIGVQKTKSIERSLRCLKSGKSSRKNKCMKLSIAGKEM